MEQPYLTIIGFARNDLYTPNRSKIHNFSLNVLVNQLEHYKIPSEIVIVEWNYLPNMPPLSETIKIETKSQYTQLKVIRVPNFFHQKYRFWQHKAFHVGAAINVGIRRATGTFVLPLASDIIITDNCFKLIAERNLNENVFYRCNRHDIAKEVFEEKIPSNRNSLFKSCEDNIVQSHFPLEPERDLRIPNLHTNGCGDFCLTTRANFMKIRGFKEGADAGGLDIDGLVVHALNAAGVKEQILEDDYRLYKAFHQNSTSRALEFVWKDWQLTLEKIALYLNCRTFICSLLNFPKRRFKYAKKALFDSREKNYMKPVLKWAKGIPPFYLNSPEWGLVNEKLEENILQK